MLIKNLYIRSVIGFILISVLFNSCEKDENHPPNCKIIYPLQDTNLKRTDGLFIKANAFDQDVNMKGVKFFVDNELVLTKNQNPYVYYDTNNLELGQHKIRVEAFDKHNYKSADEVQINVIGEPPIADFQVSQSIMAQGREVAFVSQAEGIANHWIWDFGDGETSRKKNPVHSYSTPGTYDVSLSVSNSLGSHTKTKKEYVVVIEQTGLSYGAEMVDVVGGTFMMGANSSGWMYDDAKPIHSVKVNSFEISKYEITNAQYASFLNYIECDPNGEYNGKLLIKIGSYMCQIEYDGGEFMPMEGKANHPVVGVTWSGASAFAQNTGGRLPTEAEWEFAARGGNQGNDYIYSGSDMLQNVGWYNYNTYETREVGLKQPNELGIYDMSGNVWEYCYDWYDKDYYSVSPENNPKGPVIGERRVKRGGSCGSSEKECTNSYRRDVSMGDGRRKDGFRIVEPKYGW